MLINILQRFRFSEEYIKERLQLLIQSIARPDRLRLLLTEIERDTKACYLCDNEGPCRILTAVIYFIMRDYSKSLQLMEDANQAFQSSDEIWNLIVSQELTGYIQDARGNSHLAHFYYREAQHLLLNRYAPTHRQDYDPDVQDLQEELQKLLLPGFSPVTLSPSSVQLSSFPVYESVQAGPDGPVWQSSPDTGYPEFSMILFDDKPHQVFSTILGIRTIYLHAHEKYAWAKVKGQSMNAARPTPICENDYALFYESKKAPHNEIVIVAREVKSGYEYLIKRYDERNKLLISETKSSNNYPPMPLTPLDYILGVVIAVAKPV